MSRTFSSPRHKALVEFVIAKRKKAGLTQVQLAERLDRYQSFITALESGQKRIDVVELMELAEAIGFDPQEAIRILKKLSSR
jgi:transcriptional regulator with XRE-family HTH domain